MRNHSAERTNLSPHRTNVGRENGEVQYNQHLGSPQLMRTYFSRQRSNLVNKDLPMDKGPEGRGMYTPAGIFFFTIKLTVPLAYVYIATFVVRDVAYKTNTFDTISNIPILRRFLLNIEHLPMLVHIWAIIEALFYVCLRLHIRYLQFKCPLEACLASAPIAELHERKELVERILDAVKHDPVSFITGWFFDVPIESISRYDMLDFLSWCLFEGRSQEHLTEAEVWQVYSFLAEIEYAISVHLYGLLEPSLSNPRVNLDFECSKVADDCRTEGITTIECDDTLDTSLSDSSLNHIGEDFPFDSKALHIITGDGNRPQPRKGNEAPIRLIFH